MVSYFFFYIFKIKKKNNIFKQIYTKFNRIINYMQHFLNKKIITKINLNQINLK